MSSSFFSSCKSEQRWANQFNDHFIIYFENRPSIFRVPKTKCDENPEAYAPKQVGLGAYHHFSPELDDQMESKKLGVLKKFLKPDAYRNFKSLIVDQVKELEQSIRACYNNYLDLDGDTLAWIMAIDGTYLLYLLNTAISPSDNNSSTTATTNSVLLEDVVKLENQIPAVVLKKIIGVLKPQGLINDTKGPVPVQRGETDSNPPDNSDRGSDMPLIPVMGTRGEGGSKSTDDSQPEPSIQLVPITGTVTQRETVDSNQPNNAKHGSDVQLVPIKGIGIQGGGSNSNPANNPQECFDGQVQQFLIFCEAHSPLKLSSEIDQFVGDPISAHLLALLYNLIMENWLVQECTPKKELNKHSLSASQYMASFNGSIVNLPTDLPFNLNGTPLESTSLVQDEENLQQAATLLGNITGFKPLMLLARLPMSEGTGLFRLFNRAVKSTVEEIEIPSVSQLHEITSLEFEKWDGKGIGIRFKEQKRVLCLPVMCLNTSSEVILRNLKAFEEASGGEGSYKMSFSEYLDFVCGIIDTAKDVKLLRERKIIFSEMEDEEIAKMFNRIGRSSNAFTGQKDVLQQTAEQLKEGYDDSLRVRVWRSISQQFVRSQDFIRFIVYVLVVLLLGVQAFCSVYRCSPHWFHN